ncbi:MAG: vitamin K epoxide reductase family protein [Candidatus Niyogibacteria bacterium]|nr:vitamin K epoxide reductase family protein [Candidatus Niyogibacteria bacterium]
MESLNIINKILEPTHAVSLANFFIILSMAAIGIGETIYLIKKRLAVEPPICVIGYECRKVLESEYSSILGVHNDTLGLSFYIMVAALDILLALGINPKNIIDLLLEIIIVSGTITSAALLYLQWRVIRAWCFWCVVSAATVFVMLAVIIFGNLI